MENIFYIGYINNDRQIVELFSRDQTIKDYHARVLMLAFSKGVFDENHNIKGFFMLGSKCEKYTINSDVYKEVFKHTVYCNDIGITFGENKNDANIIINGVGYCINLPKFDANLSLPISYFGTIIDRTEDQSEL